MLQRMGLKCHRKASINVVAMEVLCIGAADSSF